MNKQNAAHTTPIQKMNIANNMNMIIIKPAITGASRSNNKHQKNLVNMLVEPKNFGIDCCFLFLLLMSYLYL
jgi:hypothetical protein